MERDLVSERFGPEPHSEEGESRNSISEFRVWGQGREASNPDSAGKHRKGCVLFLTAKGVLRGRIGSVQFLPLSLQLLITSLSYLMLGKLEVSSNLLAPGRLTLPHPPPLHLASSHQKCGSTFPSNGRFYLDKTQPNPWKVHYYFLKVTNSWFQIL